MTRLPLVSIAMPPTLRDRIASHRVHARQAFYEVIAAALDFVDGVTPTAIRPVPLVQDPSLADD